MFLVRLTRQILAGERTAVVLAVVPAQEITGLEAHHRVLEAIAGRVAEQLRDLVFLPPCDR